MFDTEPTFPLLRVISNLCAEFSAAFFISSVLSIHEPMLLLTQWTCGIFFAAIAFTAEWALDSLPNKYSWT